MSGRQRARFFVSMLALFLPLACSSLLFADSLPAPWQSADVGDVGLAGSASIGVADMHVNGAGSDIWGTADSFQFVYQPFHDGQILADFGTQTATDGFAKTGIMIRMSLDPGSPHVILDIKPDGSFEFMTRQSQDGPTTFINGGPFSGRLQLIRRHGVVTAQECRTTCRALGTATFPTGAALAGVAVTSHDPSVLNHVTVFNSPLIVMDSVLWFSVDVGNTGLAGDSFLDDDTYTVRGAGADMWGPSDSYRAVRRTFIGDGFIAARVTSEQAAQTFAKAGIELDNDDKVLLDVRPNGVIEFMARKKGGDMQFLAGSAASFPVWLKLERNGTQVTGYMSPDGQAWQTVGIASFNDVPNVNAALAVTSHDTAALNTSTFDHVVVASQFDVPAVDVGDVGIAGDNIGSQQYNGGGGDIWGTADAFNYHYQALLDDGQMVVRIADLTNTHPLAKAGVMIRDSLDPSAANLLVNVNPNGHIELLARNANGAPTQWIGGYTFVNNGMQATLPIWLKLTRRGVTLTAFASLEGSSWVTVGETAAVQLHSDALIGVAVTSHYRGVLTTATVDNLSR